MKFTTWNVNGLRAILGKGFIDSVRALDTDVLCLQEIKARPDQLPQSALEELNEIYPYQFWNPAERPGYSGTVTLARVQPDHSALGLGYPEFDTEGRVVVNHFGGIILYNIYFPNGGRDLSRVPYKLDFYARLLEQTQDLHNAGHQVAICGDFNTCHQEIDLRHPKPNSKNTGFLPEERAWVTKYLENGFIDAYRTLYPTKVEYTWWTFMGNARAKNVGWRLDYFLVSDALYPRVQDVINHVDIPGSDHCPVSMILMPESIPAA